MLYRVSTHICILFYSLCVISFTLSWSAKETIFILHIYSIGQEAKPNNFVKFLFVLYLKVIDKYAKQQFLQ